MTLILLETLIAILAYLIGNVSPAVIMARVDGYDDSAGEVHAGTLNALETLGPKAALITLIVDIGKGFIATRLGYDLMILLISATAVSQGVMFIEHIYLVSAWCAFAVVVGHVWPILLKFRGGKGVATSFGAVLATNWKLAFFCIVIFVLVVGISRIVTLGSIMSALSYVVLYIKESIRIARSIEIEGASDEYYLRAGIRFWIRTIPFILIVIIIVYRHKDNIKRIIQGKEKPIDLDFDSYF